MQPTLFGPPNVYGDTQPPRAANGDPATSHEAAARVSSSRNARAKRHREIVLALVQAFPSRTGHELWNLAGQATARNLAIITKFIENCRIFATHASSPRAR